MLQIEYKNDKVREQCTSVKAAKKLFGGDTTLTISLHARINALANAETLKDIIVQRKFRFHDLHGKLEGYFAIDVKTIREPWRIILQPLDESEQPYIPCNIDEMFFARTFSIKLQNVFVGICTCILSVIAKPPVRHFLLTEMHCKHHYSVVKIRGLVMEKLLTYECVKKSL